MTQKQHEEKNEVDTKQQTSWTTRGKKRARDG